MTRNRGHRPPRHSVVNDLRFGLGRSRSSRYCDVRGRVLASRRRTQRPTGHPSENRCTSQPLRPLKHQRPSKRSAPAWTHCHCVAPIPPNHILAAATLRMSTVGLVSPTDVCGEILQFDKHCRDSGMNTHPMCSKWSKGRPTGQPDVCPGGFPLAADFTTTLSRKSRRHAIQMWISSWQFIKALKAMSLIRSTRA